MSIVRASWIRPVTLVLLLPVLGASKCKREKEGGEDDLLGTDGTRPQSVSQSLTVVSVSPSTVPAAVSNIIEVLGSGFQAGARVYVGSTQAERATVVGSTRIEAKVPGLALGTYDVEVENPDGVTSVLRAAIRVGDDPSADCSTLTLYFDLDSNTLRGDAVSLLTSKLPCLSGANGTILIEGHADERGTIDYNLALGQRRADAVESWLTARSLASSRLRTVSFGEERPIDPSKNDSAYARNRRVEIKLGR